MIAQGPLELDVLIFGGGAAGLWLLDDLVRNGFSVLLLEADRLGAGQTVASQGIMHGGLKYSLGGLLTASARAVRDMPFLWRRCLAGEQAPDLSRTRLRAEFCHLWQTGSLSSRVAMIGARAGLSIAPETIEPDARPVPLRGCPGVVARLDEQVIEPESFLANLADRNQPRLLRIDVESGLEIESAPGRPVDLVRLINPETGDALDLRPRTAVFTAGAGNAALARRAGLRLDAMQRRPLHMVVARGTLPTINGHCVEGMHTRATITTTRDFADRTVWQIGGQIAEDGVSMDREALILHARREVETILPGVALGESEWTTYRVDRAEATTRGGRRPVGERLLQFDNVLIGWPTKLVLAPRLAGRVQALLPSPACSPIATAGALEGWPVPEVAPPPWEEEGRRWSNGG